MTMMMMNPTSFLTSRNQNLKKRKAAKLTTRIGNTRFKILELTQQGSLLSSSSRNFWLSLSYSMKYSAILTTQMHRRKGQEIFKSFWRVSCALFSCISQSQIILTSLSEWWSLRWITIGDSKIGLSLSSSAFQRWSCSFLLSPSI